MKFILVVIAFSSLLSGCEMTESSDLPVTASMQFYLTPPQVDELEAKARAGDAVAAFRLYQYYEFVKLEASCGRSFLRLAARSGHAQAQVVLGVTLIRSENSDERSDGQHFLESAASAGSLRAQEILDSYDLKTGRND